MDRVITLFILVILGPEDSEEVVLLDDVTCLFGPLIGMNISADGTFPETNGYPDKEIELAKFLETSNMGLEAFPKSDLLAWGIG